MRAGLTKVGVPLELVVVGVPLELLGEGGAGQGRSWIGILV